MILAVRPPAPADVHPAMPAPASTSPARHGFSLIELLVVLSIMATMAGLVLGGLFRSRDVNRLVAAEQVLADAIRQGRHTARSSGSPVELRLSATTSSNGEVVGAKLAGTTRVCLWSETFDKERDRDDDGDLDLLLPLLEPGAPSPPNGVVVGRSGYGWRPADAHPAAPHTLARGSTIVRGGRSDGFYLACSVQAPVAPLAPPLPAHGRILPLILIGSDNEFATSQCGIALEALNLNIHSDPDSPVWDLTGWVSNETGTRIIISSTEHALTTRTNIGTSSGNRKDPAHPLVTGRWVDVGLLYDGQRMILYMDGVRVAELRSGVPTALRAEGDLIHVGEITLAEIPRITTYSECPIDDVRLFRLGAGDIAELPGNVVLLSAVGEKPDPKLLYRILCQPDGRVEVSRQDSGTLGDDGSTPINDRATGPLRPGPRSGETATITLGHLRSPGTIQSAQVTVTRDGHVGSRLMTQPLPTGVRP